jgi:hypothetical protein
VRVAVQHYYRNSPAFIVARYIARIYKKALGFPRRYTEQAKHNRHRRSIIRAIAFLHIK